ncbi:MAG TPA: LuxR C-terminal-related transcriptional regulator [Bryobacteraceae bacterium]|nr:LuxR C-terminal-related transcriptional regulator [Bryobacteraceae bacterium]
MPSLFPEPKQADMLALRRLVDGEASGSPELPVEISVDLLTDGLMEAPQVLLTVRAKWAVAERRRRILVDRYRMTAAEVRLAELLMDGLTPTAASEKLEISIHTVRTYLKRLYNKVGVRAQAGLVRALLKAEQE